MIPTSRLQIAHIRLDPPHPLAPKTTKWVGVVADANQFGLWTSPLNTRSPYRIGLIQAPFERPRWTSLLLVQEFSHSPKRRGSLPALMPSPEDMTSGYRQLKQTALIWKHEENIEIFVRCRENVR